MVHVIEDPPPAFTAAPRRPYSDVICMRMHSSPEALMASCIVVHHTHDDGGRNELPLLSLSVCVGKEKGACRLMRMAVVCVWSMYRP